MPQPLGSQSTQLQFKKERIQVVTMVMKPFGLQRYGSASGNTGVAAFAILPEGLLVQFRNGEAYLYDDQQPGAEHVSRMTGLARQGHGLSTYISQHVQGRYRLKLTKVELRTLLKEVNASREQAASD